MTTTSADPGARFGIAGPAELAVRHEPEWVLDGPWEKGELTALAARLGLGLVGLLVAWIGCSGTVQFSNQQAWTAGAIGAVVLALSGVASWIQTGLRNLNDLERVLLFAAQQRFAPTTVAPPVAARPAKRPVSELVTGSGMTLYHRPDCLLMAGKPPTAITRTDARALTACGVCNP